MSQAMQARGVKLMTGLETLKAKHELVSDVRGKGLMRSLELVSDSKTKVAAAKDIVATADVERIVSALDAGLSKVVR